MALSSVALTLGLLAAGEPVTHPIHSTTMLLTATGPRQLSGELRAFLEDLPPGADSAAIVRYLGDRLTTEDGAGRPGISVGAIGIEGPVITIRVALVLPVPLERFRLKSELLHEKFADQVNVVQVTSGTRTTTTVFVKGDRAKPLVGR